LIQLFVIHVDIICVIHTGGLVDWVA